MTIYDAAMAVVLVGGLIRGAWRGITWQLASIGSLVLGYLFAYPISAQIAPMLPGPAEASRALSMAAAYAVVSGSVFAVAWMVRGAIHKLKFDAFDRHLGMMLGGVEGVAVGILLTLLVVSVSPSTREPIFSSPSGKIVGSVMSAIGPVLPGEVRRILEPFWNHAVGTGSPAVADQDADAPASTPESQGQSQSQGQGQSQSQSPAVASELPALPAPAPVQGLAPATPDVTSKPTRPSPVDPSVFPVVGQAEQKPAVAPSTPPQGQAEAAPSVRSVLDSIVDQGKQAVEQAVVESLDSDPDQKAASLKELIEKDKKRLQNAVSGVVGGVKQNVTRQVQGRTGQVQSRVNQVQDQAVRARRQAERKFGSVLDRASQALDQAIDQQFEKLDKLGGLEPAPEKKPQ